MPLEVAESATSLDSIRARFELGSSVPLPFLVVDVSSLVAEVSCLEADVSSLVGDVSCLVADMSSLVADVSSLVAEVSSLEVTSIFEVSPDKLASDITLEFDK